MRSIAGVLLVLGVVNAVLVGLRRSASAERSDLVAASTELADRAESASVSSERRRQLDALLERARPYLDAPRDIGALRDVLVDAERGLAIDRLSLDFRPEDQLPPELGGARVLANLRGRFDAVYEYLRRIEALFLPLTLDSLTLRGDADVVTLTVQWAARWPRGDAANTVELSPSAMAQLGGWLESVPPAGLERNLFAFRDDRSTEEIVDTAPPPPNLAVPGELELAAEPERPVLTGFVLARPELEPDVRRRVLAAIRYEGETRLVMVGETVGGFVVDSMEARDSVTLTRSDTGERIRLTFQ